MHSLQGHLQPAIFTSLLPLLACAFLHLSSNHLLAQKVLQTYGNFTHFILMMLSITLLLNLKSFRRTFSKADDVFKNFSKTLVKRFLFLSLIYCCYQPLGVVLQTHLSAKLPAATDHFHETLQNLRILEQNNNLISLSESHLICSEQLSLSVGRSLSSIVLDAWAMTSSRNGRFIYTLENYGNALRILDVSNVKIPVISSTLKWNIRYSSPSNILQLSEDEKTLFISNFNDLHIIDVSNPTRPNYLGKYENIREDYELRSPTIYKTSLVISQDKNYLFASGYGLRVFDISNFSKPIVVSSMISEKNFPGNSLALSINPNYLFIMGQDQDLVIFDISNPKNSAIASISSTNQSANSIILSDDKKTAFVLSTSQLNEVSLQKIDVSNPLSPRILKLIPMVGLKSLFPPSIMATSPCGRYIFISIMIDSRRNTELRMLDTIDEKVLSHNKSLLPSTSAMIFLPKSGYLIGSVKSTYVTFFELFPDFQNRKTFGLSEGPIKKTFIKNNTGSFQFSSDRKTLFIATTMTRNGTFEIVNLSPMTPLSSYFSNKPILAMSISPDSSRAILLLSEEIHILDISNKASPILLGKSTIIDPPDFYQGIELDSNQAALDWFISNSNTVVIYFYRMKADLSSPHATFKEENYFKIFNISNPSNITQQVSTAPGTLTEIAQMAFLKDQKTVFLCKNYGELFVYDFSNVSNPVKLTSFIHRESGGSQSSQSCVLSPDESVLALRMKDANGISKLKFFNVSDVRNPIYLSQITLPKRIKNSAYLHDSAFSFDQNVLYVSQSESLLSLDISDIKNPQVLGILPNSELNINNCVSDMSLTPDGKAINLITTQGYLYQMDLRLPETLYIRPEKFGLGEKFSDTLSILKQNEFKEYEIIDTSTRKLIQSRFVNFEIIGLETSSRLTSLLLPDWIRINTENNLLTIQPMSQYDIDPYTLCSSFSKKVSKDAFSNLTSSISSEEVITALISMGYLDSQLFITNKLSSLEYFFLPTPYNQMKESIYKIIKTHLIEACSHFEVVSSLNLITTENKLRIKTPSSYVVKLNIEVEPNGRFLTKSYGLLQPLIGEKSISVSLEGSTKEINSLLQKLVIDMALPNTTCNGNITIDDRLNPPITREITNISKYFIENVSPIMNENMTIQYQIDQASIYTGQYFAIDIARNTFIDSNADRLNYHVVLNKTGDTRLPQWLIYNDLVLKGTPPEELFNRDIDLLIIVENEFKRIQIPFQIHIKISMSYVMKLVVKNSPYIMTMLGFIIYANIILNILGKRWYKHSKMYFLKIDEEVTSNIIFPVLFIQQENQEKNLILKHLPKTICQKLFCKSLNKDQILSYFLDQGGKLDKVKLVEVINETVNQEIPRKQLLRSYLSENPPRKALVIQLIINTLVDWQLDLDQEAPTRKVFNQIKHHCYDFVECTPSGRFVVNQIVLQRKIMGSDRRGSQGNFSSSDDTKERLLKETLIGKMNSSQVNQDLLENALISYLYKQQSVDCFAAAVKVLTLQKFPKNFIYRFFKKDLREIQIDYGFNYKIQNGVLNFSGTPTHDFVGTTVVLQVVNRKQRILKEIWIVGIKNQENINRDVSNQLDETLGYWKNSYSVL